MEIELTLTGHFINAFPYRCAPVLVRLIAFVLAALAIPASIAWAAAGSAMRVQVVDERGMPVPDAVVEVDSPGWQRGPITFPWRMAMAQKNQTFVPGTLVVARGSTVAFPNLDTVRHSIYSFSKPAHFTIELYSRDQTRTHTFPIAGSVALGCNIHDTMRGYIRVVDTPFAGKTDANGYVTLDGVPSGPAKLTVWHPRVRTPSGEVVKRIGGPSDQKITVSLR
jgi:hypothetical protein